MKARAAAPCRPADQTGRPGSHPGRLGGPSHWQPAGSDPATGPRSAWQLERLGLQPATLQVPTRHTSSHYQVSLSLRGLTRRVRQDRPDRPAISREVALSAGEVAVSPQVSAAPRQAGDRLCRVCRRLPATDVCRKSRQTCIICIICKKDDMQNMQHNMQNNRQNMQNNIQNMQLCGHQ